MTAVDFVSDLVRPAAAAHRNTETCGFHVADTHWGYEISRNESIPVGLMIGQFLSWIAGIAALVLALAVWLIPAGMIGSDASAFRIGISAVSGSFAVLLIWYASRGLASELHVDTARGELREITRNRAGKPSVGATFGFDSVGSVFIDRTGMRERLPRGQAVLVIRLGNTAQVLPVATGPEHMLEPLRDRLGRDLVIRPRQPVGNLRVRPVPSHIA